MARYSDLAKEYETVTYFFVFQEIGEEPRKMQEPIGERRVIGQLAQSESQ